MSNLKRQELEEEIKKKLIKKLYKWWRKLADGNIIVIYDTGKTKTLNVDNKKWMEYDKDDKVIAIIWSAQSIDSLIFFVDKLVKKKIDDITPSKLLEKYKKYFVKDKLFSKKDYRI